MKVFFFLMITRRACAEQWERAFLRFFCPPLELQQPACSRSPKQKRDESKPQQKGAPASAATKCLLHLRTCTCLWRDTPNRMWFPPPDGGGGGTGCVWVSIYIFFFTREHIFNCKLFYCSEINSEKKKTVKRFLIQ